MSWHVLTGQPAAPARLGRLGPVTAAQALPLAALAAAGVTGRVTVIIPAATLDQPGQPGSADGTGIRAAVLRAARRAATRAEQAAAADEAAGGCAHTTATPAYRPATRIREPVEARDQTCRQPYCRQAAWRTDLDHTTPWHKGAPTCPCNIGGQRFV